ncbi:hypothetical protein [Fimbriiglobus ruber]|uniref:DUF4276 family protein n=1 Tax=Fimbriiglobus ruber TaxID=1908690 RepID=A0A225DUD6_9BACT|nr:hypothetical protein [Fimbriiglobus ruber]OWK45012.1 hypothetical protein FRUB_01343 [Fimbriiglobus ruber]
MKTYLLVEGQADLEILRRLLPSDIEQQTTIAAAGGRSNITSMARSLLVTKRKPLALVMDADAVEDGAVRQQRQISEELLRSVSAGVPFKVILMVPEIEAWFFLVPDALERLSGENLTTDLKALAVSRPKEVLAQLFKSRGGSPITLLANGMTEDEIQSLRETPPGKELLAFLSDPVANKIQPLLV